jgi:hypothetical protein
METREKEEVPQDEVTIGSYLDQPLRAGEPDVSGPMAVYPVFGGEPKQEYSSMGRARALGFTVKEQPGGGSVRDVVVHNPTGTAVLIYEGEEVLGGQQNRTFDTSVLIGPGETLVAPVSCVEAGRWDGSRNREAFRPSPQAADPRLRRKKSEDAHRAKVSGLEERANQTRVWEEVATRSSSMAMHSPTGASHDLYEGNRDRLHAIASDIRLHDGQIGMVYQVGGRVLTLDLVSRPDVFADLHAPLVQGYCLDALGTTRPVHVRGSKYAERFLAKVAGNRVFESDGIGLGRGFRFENPRAVGSGLVSGEELIQLSVFTSRPDADDGIPPPANRQARRTRISRPSRRHS